MLDKSMPHNGSGPAEPSASDAAPPPPGLAGRWRQGTVLKQDVFSTVERGTFISGSNKVPAVVRRIDTVPWWSWLLARHFLRREAKALALAGPLGIAPRALHANGSVLVRSWVDGIALHIAKPVNDDFYFRSAKAALRALHRTGVTHNDLAKEQNWLRGTDGRAYLTDFQLATRFSGRSRLFRVAAHEDLRHLLKHKRRYAPASITASERRILARKSWIARTWLRTGKRVYVWFTRGVLGFTDREGAGPRLVYDAPQFAAVLNAQPGVREVAILPFPDRRTGTGLYAFVEAHGTSETALQAALAAKFQKARLPEHLQVVEQLPRNADGSPHREPLMLIAMNQLDLLDTITMPDSERPLVARIVDGRKNFMDRFNTNR